MLECQALVLAPTRELAQQIETVMRALGDFLQVWHLRLPAAGKHWHLLQAGEPRVAESTRQAELWGWTILSGQHIMTPAAYHATSCYSSAFWRKRWT